MTILIDHRSGSEELVCYPPFNRCPKCDSITTITRREIKKQRRIISAVCSTTPSHRLLGTLTQLSRLNRTSQTSPDVIFTGCGPDNSKVSIAIEIKSVTDLLSSISNGRLPATQIPDLLTHDHPWIVWYGSVREHNGKLQTRSINKRTGLPEWYDYTEGKRTFTLAYLENFLDSPLLTATHLRVKHYPSLAAIAHWIGACYYPLWQKPYSDHKSLSRFDNTTRLPPSHLLPTIDEHTYQLMLYAAANPSIEFARAFAIANHFDSAIQMFNAGVDEWAEIGIKSKSGRVTRIGPVRAQAIVSAIRRSRKKGK